MNSSLVRSFMSFQASELTKICRFHQNTSIMCLIELYRELSLTFMANERRQDEIKLSHRVKTKDELN